MPGSGNHQALRFLLCNLRRWPPFALASLFRFNQFIQLVKFRCAQRDGEWQVRLGTMQQGQPGNPPPNDAENGDQVHQSFGASQLGCLGLAAGFEHLVEHLDFLPQRIPV